ncbi:MAG: HAD-IIIA family hydrolase [Gammaproteobacteria bacterium]|nr:HAD-IIIA family hydrolase [Gammaproteobacteria bacterium]
MGDEKISGELLARAAAVRLVIFDVDGVLTDGGLHFDQEGREHKVFNSRDGHGMKMLMESGVEIGIITGRTSVAVSRRMEGLGVRHLYQGQQDKVPAYEELSARLGLKPEQVAYVGDDVVDLPIMCRIGLPVAVADAHELVRETAAWTTPNPGGRGAARDVCELILKAGGVLDDLWARYLGKA